MKILVTGGAGFIGSHFVRKCQSMGDEVIILDKLTYAGDMLRVNHSADRIFYHLDVNDIGIISENIPDVVVNFAAETHVDRSIDNSFPFIETNIKGVQAVINFCLKNNVRLVHISTDEVYGEIREGRLTENAPYNPGNPYSASKASGELLIKAAIRTFGLKAKIIRPSNNYGPWQYPEKFLPLLIIRAMNDEKIPVYGDGCNVREWLFVEDCAEAIYTIMLKGEDGEIYNVGSGDERRNIDVVSYVLSLMGKPKSLIDFVKDRPGHDVRYAIDFSKARELGWFPKTQFFEGINCTLQWAKENSEWLGRKIIK